MTNASQTGLLQILRSRRKPLITSNEARTKERSDRGRFSPLGKMPLSYRGAYRVPLFIWSVCQSVCNVRRFYCLRGLYQADLHKPGIYGSGRVWANAWDVFPRMSSRVGRGRRDAVDFVVFWVGRIFFRVFFFEFFFPTFFSLRTHTACCKYEATLPYLPLYKYFFQRTRPTASTRRACLMYLSTSTGVRTGCRYLISLSVCACVSHSSFF